MKKYSKYKETGIDWAPIVPNSWSLASIRSLVVERKEKNSPEKTRELLALSYELGITLYRDKIYNLDRVKENYEEYKIVHEGDLVLSPNDIIKGSVHISKYYGCISPMYLIFKNRDEGTINLQFLSYFLRNAKAGRKFFSLAKGLIGSILDNGKYVTRRMTVSRNDLLSFKVFLPPIEEQNRIVSYLDKKITLIESCKCQRERELQTLNELKQAEIASVVTRGLNLNVPMKDSGIPWIGQIPEHWNVKTLRAYLRLISEKNHPDATLLSVTREQGVIVRDVESKEENHNFIPEDLSGYKYVRKGQFVINKMKAWQGSYGVSLYDGIVSPAYYVCDLDFPNKEYFSLAIRSKTYVDFFARWSKGIRVGQWDLEPIALKSVPFLEPPVKEMREIVDYVKSKTQKIDTMIEALTAEIERLTEYKQRLISDVVTGQVDVRGEEIA